MKALTPQQTEFLSYYLDPKSETYSNATQSSLKAGYSEEYSKNMTGQLPEWLSENISKLGKVVLKAEKNLDNFMDSDDERVRADMTKFALTRLKKEVYSDRTEHTGKGGKPISVKQANINANEATEEEIDSFLLGELS